MKAVILHGTSADHSSNWFPWLKEELEKIGYEVWVPDLPKSDLPNAELYNDFLLSSGWDFNDNLLIGHSAGAVEILRLLPVLPAGTKINTAVLVGSFTERMMDDPRWEVLKGMLDSPFDFRKIKENSKQFIFVHSNDDSNCPIKQAEFLHDQIGGEFVKFTGMNHFSYGQDKRFNKFPELLEVIKEKVMS